MTATSNPVSGEQPTARQPIQPKYGLSVLRDKEARTLISLICDALEEVLGVTSAMYSAIHNHKNEAEASSDELCHMRDDALACLGTSEHYLLMLGSLLDEQANADAEWAERASYPVYLPSREALHGR